MLGSSLARSFGSMAIGTTLGQIQEINAFESFLLFQWPLNVSAAKVGKKEQVRTKAKNTFLKVSCPSQLRSLLR